MKKIILIGTGALLLASCVSKKKYNELLQAKQEADDKAYRLTIMNSDLTRVSEEMAEDYKTAVNNLAELEREYENYKRQQITGKKEALISQEEAFTVVEKMPEFPGGKEKLYRFLGKSVRYPEIARSNNVEGKVYTQFVVEKDGSITGIKVVRGIGHGCDKEAIRVVKKMPKWIPGENKGKKVRVKYILPFSFKLH